VTRRCLAISGVNLTEGGPLTVLQEFVDACCELLSADWEIVVFVHDRRLFAATRPRYIEVPHAKKSWLRRLRVEWCELRTHSVRIKPDLWVSMHDITPLVGRVPQAVYCHNPAPFFPLRFLEVWFEPSLLPFRLMYKPVYWLSIKRNFAVIVQQAWLRDEFTKWTGDKTEIIVAHPHEPETAAPPKQRNSPRSARFLYPALPRPFKNMELICRAVELLERDERWCGEVVLTVDAIENRYARWLWSRFGQLKTVRFVGRQSREQMELRYADADCLLFPSRRETWGLPVTEAKQRGLPMFVAALPYARETVGDYDRVEFIDINDHRALAGKMLAFQEGKFEFKPACIATPGPPFVSGWPSLIHALLEGAGLTKD
jgi:glycosyltransferase involved in cell wall biosynthesis